MGEGAVDLGIAGLGPATSFARGGFAQVYRAEQLSLRRPVAVKVLFAPPSDDVAFARFERECHSLGAVSNHPNIVVVHDRGVTADGRPYLIMEYRQGGSLADRLAADGPLPISEVRRIGIRISDALAVAHGAGVIHRDVKPANILLSAYGEPALADFGIARIDGGHKTTTGHISASVAHASREVLGGAEPSAQSDVYSLGSTLLELSTGRTPFQRPGDATVWQLINRVMTEPAPDPRLLGVPEPMATVIEQALDPDLSVRHTSAVALREALEGAGGGDGDGSRPRRRVAGPTVTAPTLAALDPTASPAGSPDPTAGATPPAATSASATTPAPPDQNTGRPDATAQQPPSAQHDPNTGTPGATAQQPPGATGAIPDATPTAHQPLLAAVDRTPDATVEQPAPDAGHPAGSGPRANVTGEAVAAGGDADDALHVAASAGRGGKGPRRRWTRQLVLLPAIALLGLGAAAGAMLGLGALTEPAPTPRVEVAQAGIEPLNAAGTYAVTIRNAASDARYRLVVDGEPADQEPTRIVVYRGQPGRHEIAVEVVAPDGATTITAPVDVYVTPGPPEPGYRVNLAAVAITPENWPIALRQFDDLVEEGHTDLVLSPGASGDFWIFYIPGYGDDREAAWDYCASYDLDVQQCYAAEVPPPDDEPGE